jgi:tRNA(His) 5'-end guanylyltransferase
MPGLQHRPGVKEAWQMKQALINRIEKLVQTVPQDQLEDMAECIKHFMIERNKEIIKKFSEGDEVSWMQSKNNETFGTIKKINAASASVITDDNWQWDVPAHQLKKHEFLKGD